MKRLLIVLTVPVLLLLLVHPPQPAPAVAAAPDPPPTVPVARDSSVAHPSRSLLRVAPPTARPAPPKPTSKPRPHPVGTSHAVHKSTWTLPTPARGFWDGSGLPKSNWLWTTHLSTYKASLLTYALHLLGSRAQVTCLDFIASRESSWRYNAQGAGSTYGIPQALPGSKMASAGADWATNPLTQVRWMASYVDARYGSACGAWSHWRAARSY